MSEADYRLVLPQSRIPTHWYNIVADFPVPLAPMLHPGTKQPINDPAVLAPLFPMDLIMQEVSRERYIAIPDEVRDMYRLWRPTPLVRAVRLEKALDTPAHIYYKYEGQSPAGSHKLNTALAQAYYNKQAGVTRIATETGAGQWGSALAIAGAFFSIDIDVFMVKISYEQKPYRRSLMQAYGATVTPSPSNRTQAGRKVLAEHPDTNGSLGIAISEAVEMAATHDDTRYSLGSVLNHVLLHQTVIGEEALDGMQEIGEYPDVVIGCVGGGSNFAGLAYPFMRRRLTEGLPTRFVAVEPASCPSLTRGRFTFDYGDTVGLGPIAKMYTLGHDFEPAGIHAGGLRYHGMSPTISALTHEGYIEPRAYHQRPCFEAALQFARTEGIMPAPESSHAIRASIDEALEARVKGEKRVILFNLSGHGNFDMTAYDSYLSGKLADHEMTDEELNLSLATLPEVPEPSAA